MELPSAAIAVEELPKKTGGEGGLGALLMENVLVAEQTPTQ
jgi:hypothetical protein